MLYAQCFPLSSSGVLFCASASTLGVHLLKPLLVHTTYTFFSYFHKICKFAPISKKFINSRNFSFNLVFFLLNLRSFYFPYFDYDALTPASCLTGIGRPCLFHPFDLPIKDSKNFIPRVLYSLSPTTTLGYTPTIVVKECCFS